MSDDPKVLTLPAGEAMTDPYIEPSTGILRNKLGIRSWDELKQAEALAVRLNLKAARTHASLSLASASADPVAAWRDVHAMLFGALYEWAGQFRTIPIGRADEKPCFNACPETLDAECRTALAAAIGDTAFLDNLGHHYAEMNFQHPFREGNGRTLKILFGALALSKGISIDWSRLDRTAYEAALRHWNRTADSAPLTRALTATVPSAPKSRPT